VAVMCPGVIWDERTKLFRMWYSGGEQYEPDAIGYATSPDGLHWTKAPSNPVFGPGAEKVFDQARVTGCQVLQRGGWCSVQELTIQWGRASFFVACLLLAC